MPKEQSVNVLDSLDDEDQSQEAREAERQRLEKEVEEKVRTNLRAEYERKKNEEVESIKSGYETRIAELEGKTRLTEKEEKELLTLEQKVKQIEANPESKPWEVHMERLVERKLKEREQAEFDRKHKADQPRAVSWIADKAKEIKVGQKELEEELLDIMEDRWLDDLPTVRVQKAFAQLQKFKSKYSQDHKKEDETREFSETGGRVERKMTNTEALRTAKKENQWGSVLRAVSEKQASEVT